MAGGKYASISLRRLVRVTMVESYLADGMQAPATFSLIARKLPKGWGYFLAAGLDDVLTYLESLAFDEADLACLRSTGHFSPQFLDELGNLRFTGSVRALPEGTVCFPDEPLIEVTAPLIEAQLVESAIVNQIHFQTIIASKAARCVEVRAGAGWSTSACAALTGPTPDSRSPAAPTWPASTRRAMCWPVRRRGSR